MTPLHLPECVPRKKGNTSLSARCELYVPCGEIPMLLRRAPGTSWLHPRTFVDAPPAPMTYSVRRLRRCATNADILRAERIEALHGAVRAAKLQATGRSLQGWKISSTVHRTARAADRRAQTVAERCTGRDAAANGAAAARPRPRGS